MNAVFFVFRDFGWVSGLHVSLVFIWAKVSCGYVCDPSRHLQEPKSQKNLKKGLWGGLQKVPKNTRKSLKIPENVRKSEFLDSLGHSCKWRPTKIAPWWVARLKFSISLENYNPGRRS